MTTAPASDDSGGGLTPWLVVGAVTVLAVLALGAAWRSLGGPQADAESDAEADAVEPTGDTAPGRVGTRDGGGAPRA